MLVDDEENAVELVELELDDNVEEDELDKLVLLDVLETVERDEDDAEELTINEVEVDLVVDLLVTDKLVEVVVGVTAPNSYNRQ